MSCRPPNGRQVLRFAEPYRFARLPHQRGRKWWCRLDKAAPRLTVEEFFDEWLAGTGFEPATSGL
jgi:hypothetical protein